MIMTELQSRLLCVLKWFHELCKKENLVYYAQGGTVLGAVRHKGFIPWDDDIDVGMPRKDYEKFIKLSEKVNKHSQFIIEFSGKKKDFVYPYCKIYDRTTTLVENTRYKTKRGIYIDVFPIDGIGNTLEESINNFKKVDKMINLLCTRVCAIRKERSWYKNIAILLSRCIPESMFSTLDLMKKIETLSKQKEYDKYDFVANLCGNWHEKEIMDKKWVEKPILCKFENMQIFIPGNYDAYLTRMYGDYMKLPPIEKRCTHHDFLYIDLNKSFMK